MIKKHAFRINVRQKPYRILCLIFCIILIGVNLRPSMTAIGPMIKIIQGDITLSFVQAAYLTMLPLMVMGVGMFLVRNLSNRLGEEKTLAMGLLLIGLATLSRFYSFQAFELITSAIVSGFGIAIIQALMPGFIKSRVKNTAAFIGIYTTSIMAGAVLAAALTPYLSDWMHSWQASLAIWGGLALTGLTALMFEQKYPPGINHSSDSLLTSQHKPFYLNSRAWQLGIFFGLTTSGYTTTLAWLAPYYLDLGYGHHKSGLLLSWFTLVQVVAGLVIPFFASKNQDRRVWLILSLLTASIGLLGLYCMPRQLLLLWPTLLGIGIGALFPLGLIISMDHIDDPGESGQLTVFVQGSGYIIAALSPLVAGLVRSNTDSFQLPWLLLGLLMLLLIPLALVFNPAQYQSKFQTTAIECPE